MTTEEPVSFVRRPKPFNMDRAIAEYRAKHPDEKPHEPRGVAPMRGRQRVFASDPAPFFEAGFHEILETRMQGLPIVNPALSVKVLPFRRIGKYWLSCAVTPWSIQGVIARAEPKAWQNRRAGTVDDVELPGGTFSFLSVQDSILGSYLMCSLKSPLFDIPDQATAETFASVCLDLLSGVREIEEEPEEEGLAVPQVYEDRSGRQADAAPAPSQSGPATRRQFLRRMAGLPAEDSRGADDNRAAEEKPAGGEPAGEPS